MRGGAAVRLCGKFFSFLSPLSPNFFYTCCAQPDMNTKNRGGSVPAEHHWLFQNRFINRAATFFFFFFTSAYPCSLIIITSSFPFCCCRTENNDHTLKSVTATHLYLLLRCSTTGTTELPVQFHANRRTFSVSYPDAQRFSNTAWMRPKFWFMPSEKGGETIALRAC